MESLGIVRNLDKLGRIVIPKEIRAILEINYGDPMEIVQVNKEIVVRKYNKGCVFCGGNEALGKFMSVLVCDKCKKALNQD